jgi:hypothetical protein
MGIGSRFRAVALAGMISGFYCAASPLLWAADPADSGLPLNRPGIAAPSGGTVIKDLTPPHFPPADLFGHEGHAPAGGHGGHNGHGVAHAIHHEHHHEGGLFGRAEYLLLRPRRGSFDFAIVDPNRDLTPTGQLESLNYELGSGVRGLLGYRIPDEAWDILFAYTYLQSNADRLLTAPAGGVIYPTLTRPGLIDEANTALGTASLLYNVFDIEVGRRLHTSEQVSARVFGGVRFVTIRQNFDAIYDGRDANQTEVRTQAKFDGFGPILGGEGTINIFRGWHVYGRGSAGLLTGRTVNTISETNNAGATTFADLDYTTRKVVPTVGVAIGGGWQHHRVSVRVGYEITHYIGLNEPVRFADDVSQGRVLTRPADLSLEGLFVQFGLAF